MTEVRNNIFKNVSAHLIINSNSKLNKQVYHVNVKPLGLSVK